MRIIDWSSDVCSFDLIGLVTPDQEHSMRFIFATLLAILPAAALAEPLSFDEALARAANSAPLLDAREQQIRARQSAAITAGQLPEPKLRSEEPTYEPQSLMRITYAVYGLYNKQQY